MKWETPFLLDFWSFTFIFLEFHVSLCGFRLLFLPVWKKWLKFGFVNNTQKVNQWFNIWLWGNFVCVFVLYTLTLFFLWLYSIRISSHLLISFSAIHILFYFSFLAHNFNFLFNIFFASIIIKSLHAKYMTLYIDK